MQTLMAVRQQRHMPLNGGNQAARYGLIRCRVQEMLTRSAFQLATYWQGTGQHPLC